MSNFDGSRQKSLMIFRLFIRLILLFSIFLLVACSGEPQKLMRVASHKRLGYEPLHLARFLGFFDQTQIQLYEMPSEKSSIRAFRNGFLDGVALTLDEALNLLHDQVPVKVVFVMAISNATDALLVQPEIKEMQQLRGKSIGVENIALGTHVLARGLEKVGLDLHDVKLVYYPINKHQSAFEQKKVDGLVTFEPVSGVLQKAGANVLLDSADFPYEIFDVFVVHESVLETNPEAIRLLVNAWFRALDYMDEHHEDAADVIARRLGITPEECLVSFDGVIFPSRNENRDLLTGMNPQLAKAGANVVNQLLHLKLMNSPVEAEDLIYPGIEFFLLSNFQRL